MDDLLQGGGEMNELMSTKMCSPLLIYLAVIVTSGLSVYLTRDHLKNTIQIRWIIYSICIH